MAIAWQIGNDQLESGFVQGNRNKGKYPAVSAYAMQQNDLSPGFWIWVMIQVDFVFIPIHVKLNRLVCFIDSVFLRQKRFSFFPDKIVLIHCKFSVKMLTTKLLKCKISNIDLNQESADAVIFER
jgi:hypothetical protein